MRASVRTYLLAAALVAGLVGCGDTNDTTIVVVEEPGTPTGAVRTATPAASPTPLATATSGQGPTAIATVTATRVAATPTSGASTATPAPTATPAGTINPDVQRIAADVLPFLAHTDLLTGGSIDALTAASPPRAPGGTVGRHLAALRSDPCPDGGARDDDEEFPARTLTFVGCVVSDQLGSFRFDGEVVITLMGFGGSIAFDVTLTDQAASRAVAFAGTLPLTVESDGFVLDGPLAVTTPDGGFTLRADEVTIDGNRKIISGSGAISDDGDDFDIATVAFVVVRRGAAAELSATLDDASVEDYILDLESGELERN